MSAAKSGSDQSQTCHSYWNRSAIAATPSSQATPRV